MKKSRFSEEQIIGILKEHDAGAKTAELCREHEVSAATFYGWKQEFGGMDVSEAQRLKGLKTRPPLEAAGGGAEPAWRSAEGCDPKKRPELAGLRADVRSPMPSMA